MDAMLAAFGAANPTIDIDRDVRSIEDTRAIIQTALNSGTGPDVLKYDTGPGFVGIPASAGLIKPLDDLYAGQLASVLLLTKERVTFDGKAYGVGNQPEFIAVYHKRETFAANNVAVPTTYAEFQAACATLKDAGITLIAFGNVAGWPAFHAFSACSNHIVPQNRLKAMIRRESSWDDPKVTAAIQSAFVDTVASACFNPSVNAVSYDDANALFSAGQSGMTVTGGWMINGFKGNSFATGFFFLPAQEGMPTMPPAGLGGGFFVHVATTQRDAANVFLPFLFDPANAALWVEGMSAIPSSSLEGAGVEMSPLLAEAATALSAGRWA